MNIAPTYELTEHGGVHWLIIRFGNFTYQTGFCIANIDNAFRQDKSTDNVTSHDATNNCPPYLNLANDECDGIPLTLFHRFAEAIRANEKRNLFSDCVRVGSENKLVNETGQLILDISYGYNCISIYTLRWASQMSYVIHLTEESSVATAAMFDEIHAKITEMS